MAASQVAIFVQTIVATAAILANRGVTIAGAVPGAGLTALGLAQTGGAIGDAIPVNVLGTAVGEAGAAIAVGAALEFDASGRVITKTAGIAVGRALTAAANAGDQVEVLLIPS